MKRGDTVLTVKRFSELSTRELYEIYRVRTEVFVVEQDCPYQEVDGYDLDSIHVTLWKNGKILAYCRLLPKGCRFSEVSIGRVLATVRRCGYASEVVRQALHYADTVWQADKIILDAQTYAEEFYRKLGFKKSSEEFLEDGIPHIQMTRIRGGTGDA